MKRTPALFALLAASLVVLAACSSDSDDADPPTTTAAAAAVDSSAFAEQVNTLCGGLLHWEISGRDMTGGGPI